jgi:hypothetical protein
MSWHNNTNNIGTLTWGSDTFAIPVIEVGINGHVYIPKVLKQRYPDEFPDKKRTTFGRGVDYQEQAMGLNLRYVTDLLNEHNWEPPDKIGKPVMQPHGGISASNGLTVTWWNETWGYVSLGVGMTIPRYYERHPPSARWELKAHPLAIALAGGRGTPGAVTGRPFGSVSITQNPGLASKADKFHIHNTDPVTGEQEANFDIVTDAMRKFVESPWSNSFQGAKADWRRWVETNLAPPDGWESLDNLEYHGYAAQVITTEHRKGTTSDAPVKWVMLQTNVTGSAHLYSESKLNTVIVENMNALQRMFTAFELQGVKFSIDTMFGADGTQFAGKQVVRGFTLKLPADKKTKGQEHPHEISVSAEGITVDCGYINDEARFVDYQKRHMKDVLSAMQDDDPFGERDETTKWSESTFKLGGQ